VTRFLQGVLFRAAPLAGPVPDGGVCGLRLLGGLPAGVDHFEPAEFACVGGERDFRARLAACAAGPAIAWRRCAWCAPDPLADDLAVPPAWLAPPVVGRGCGRGQPAGGGRGAGWGARAARLVDQEVAGLVTIGVEEAVELRLQLSRSRGRVGSHSVEILLSVVMRQVVIGSLAGALSQTEVARHHDAGPTRAPSAGPRPPSGDPLDQRLEPEGRRDPALSRGRHPFEGRRREPAEQKTGPAGRKRRHRPAHTAHLTVPHPGASSTASRPRPRPDCAGEGHLPHSPAATHQTVVSSSTRSVRSCRPGRGTSPGSWEG
jgi:hypothetical protein